MAKKLTGPGKEKILRELTEVFKKNDVYSNISIVYNNKMVIVGNSELTKESDYEKYSEPKITIKEGKKPSNYNGNDKTMVIMYDGGPMYSCMSEEFGYKWRERLLDDIEFVLGPYALGIEEIDHVSFTLIEDCTPEYEKVMDKLAKSF